MLISAILLASAAPPLVRQERFADPKPESVAVAPMNGCTRDRQWCVTLAEETKGNDMSHSVTVRRATGKPTRTTINYADLAAQDVSGLWTAPVAYRTANGKNGLLFGIVTRKSEGYSGGGASSSTLHFMRAEADSAGQVAITLMDDPVPLSASTMIRACFSEQDQKLRRNKCHDEYDLDVTLKLKPALVNDLPAFLYISKATTTPGFASRDTDNSDDARLRTMKAADFKPRGDMRCTFTRQLQANAQRTMYSLEIPDCSEYGPMQG